MSSVLKTIHAENTKMAKTQALYVDGFNFKNILRAIRHAETIIKNWMYVKPGTSGEIQSVRLEGTGR